MRRCLECLQAEVSGQAPSEKGSEETSEEVEEDEGREQASERNDTICFGYTSLLLCSYQRRVLVELRFACRNSQGTANKVSKCDGEDCRRAIMPTSLSTWLM